MIGQKWGVGVAGAQIKHSISALCGGGAGQDGEKVQKTSRQIKKKRLIICA